MLNSMKLFGTWKTRVSPGLYVTMGAVLLVVAACAFAGMSAPQFSNDQGGSACSDLPGYAALKNALAAATAAETSGLNNQMWATIVNRDGVVCAVAFSGANRGAQWPGSRAISAQKANTANAFSLDASSVATALARPPAWRCPPRTSILLYNLAAASMDYSTAIPSIPASPTRDPLRATALLLIRWLGTKSVA